jgi:NADPH2:quinone reductase
MLGHIINIGEAEGKPIENIRQQCLVRSQTFTRFHLGHVIGFPALWQEGNHFILNALQAGWLNPTIVETFSLKEARNMHEAIENRTNSGKLLLQTGPSTDS